MKNLLLCLFLLSITAQSFGQCSPTLKEIYDFEEGDKFVYENIFVTLQNGRPVYRTTYDSFQVVKNLTSGDTIRYRIQYPTITIDTTLFIDSVNHALNRCENDWVSIWEKPFIDYVIVNGRYDRQDTNDLFLPLQIDSISKTPNSKYIISIESIYYRDSSGIIVPTTSNSLLNEISQEYTKEQGMTQMNFTPFEESFSKRLIQLFRNGEYILYESYASINQVHKTQKVRIYPNPTSTLLHIEASSPIHSVKLFDTNGKMVLSVNETKSMYIGSLLPGIYIAEITSNQGIIRKKVYKK
jgi:hypothetical protein